MIFQRDVTPSSDGLTVNSERWQKERLQLRLRTSEGSLLPLNTSTQYLFCSPDEISVDGSEHRPTAHVIIRCILDPRPRCSPSALVTGMIGLQRVCSERRTELHWIFHLTGLQPGGSMQGSSPGAFPESQDVSSGLHRHQMRH